MKFTSFLILFLVGHHFFGQYEKTYPHAPIPDDFIFNTIEKTSLNLEKEDSTDLSKRSKKEYYLESNFVLNELLTSGLILFNEPISEYVNQVASEVLKDQPELFQELDFYVLRSSEINAFATNDGNIFFTIGILAKLKTEGQVASVICHEIIHYTRKHNIKSYEYSQDLEESKKSVDKTSIKDKLLAKSLYSKENEMEADKLGLELFLESSYHPNNIIGAFKALESYYIPYDFESTSQYDPTHIDPSGILSVPSNIDSNITYVVPEVELEYTTHPHISKRILIAGKLLEDITLEGEDFIFSESSFKEVQKTARFELCNEYLFERNYIKAIAAANDLLGKYPEELFLKSIIAKAWFGIYELKKQGYYDDVEASSLPEHLQPIYKLVAENDQDTIKELALQQNTKLADNDLHHKMIVQTIEDKVQEADFANQGQDSLVFIDPLYFKIDLRKKENNFRYIGSEQVRSNYAKMILQNASNLGAELQVYSTLNLSNHQIAEFNHIGDIKRFFDNVFANEKMGTNIIANNYTDLIALQEKGIRYVGLTGGISFHMKKSADQWTVLVMSMLAWPSFPLGLINFLSPNFHSLNFMIVYDVKTGQPVYEDTHFSKLRDTKATINSMLYYNLLKMKNYANN